MHETPPLIRLHDLCAELRNDQRFEKLNWQLDQGQHWAIVGGNGSGKTALLCLLLGQITPSAGTISYGSAAFDPERDIAQVSLELVQQLIDNDIRHDISDVCDNAVDAGTTLRALLQQAVQQTQPQTAVSDSDMRIDAALAQFGIAELAERGLRFVSTGQLRRALLARALVADPLIIAFDNPLDGLDRTSRASIAALIDQLMTPQHTTLFFSRSKTALPEGITHVLALDNCDVSYIGSRQQWQQQHAGAARVIVNVTPRPVDFTAPALIRFENVDVSYQEKAIFCAASFAVHTHQHTLISGPNGCGKSTLLALISGDNHKAYGQAIWLFGRRRGSGESIWDIKRQLGVVSTALHSNYPRGFNGLQVVLSGLFDSLGLYDNYGIAQRTQAQQSLDLLQLGELAQRRFEHLSYGQQRQLLLARAIVKSPALLILDEPCIGLDDEHCDQLLRQLGLIVANTDTTLLYVSHVGEEIPQGMQQLLEFVAHPEQGYNINISAV